MKKIVKNYLHTSSTVPFGMDRFVLTLFLIDVNVKSNKMKIFIGKRLFFCLFQ